MQGLCQRLGKVKGNKEETTKGKEAGMLISG